MNKRTAFILLLCLLPWVAQAHYIWIESEDAKTARVYFGEFNEGVREKAGGRLDERAAIQGSLIRSEGATDRLSFSKESDHFAVQPVSAGWVVVEDVANEVKDWTSSDIGIVKPMFYARAAVGGRLTPAEPTTDLDIIPDSKNPHLVRVFFQKQPLPDAKVMVHAPNEWSKELQANGKGEVTFATPWRGRYVVEVIHRERVPGEFQGKRYEAIRHRATFSHVY